MEVPYFRYQDDILILCQTKSQFNRCKQRMMAVLEKRRLSLSSKKTRMGAIEKGFHFLGINYLGTQPSNNIKVTQADEKPAGFAQYLSSMGGAILQLAIHRLGLYASFHMQERCVKHANR